MAARKKKPTKFATQSSVARLQARLRKLEAALAERPDLNFPAALGDAPAPAVETRQLGFTLQPGGPQSVRIRIDGSSAILAPGAPYQSVLMHAQNEQVPLLLELLGTAGQTAKIDVLHGLPKMISGTITTGTNNFVPHSIWVDW